MAQSPNSHLTLARRKILLQLHKAVSRSSLFNQCSEESIIPKSLQAKPPASSAIHSDPLTKHLFDNAAVCSYLRNLEKACLDAKASVNDERQRFECLVKSLEETHGEGVFEDYIKSRGHKIERKTKHNFDQKFTHMKRGGQVDPSSQPEPISNLSSQSPVPVETITSQVAVVTYTICLD